MGRRTGALRAAPPGEVPGLRCAQPQVLEWGATDGAVFYGVYRGEFTGLASGVPARCHGHEVGATSFQTPAVPAGTAGYFYLVTATSAGAEEGSAGGVRSRRCSRTTAGWASAARSWA